MFIQPKQIISPTGAPVTPKIVTREYQGKIYTEAHYYDPNSGIFIQKGVISVQDKGSTTKTDLGNARLRY